MTHFTIIGLNDNPHVTFSPELQHVIQSHSCFSGGQRHHELVRPFLPEEAEWIDIKVPLSDAFEQYRNHDKVVVFASGDPFFYGFGATIQKRMPDAEITLYPGFNSIQTLAHRLLMPYQDMRMVSLTGRPWHELDRALIENAPLIGVLTDQEHTPASIAGRMREYGFTHYRMYIGEHLGNPDREQITRSLPLCEIEQDNFDTPNCLILDSVGDKMPYRQLGIPDHLFEHLDGRDQMITKAAIRILDLSYLQLDRRKHFWDIGFCTGSVSIEAKKQYPHLHIQAFEVRTECKTLMEVNTHRLSVPGIDVHIGNFLKEDVSALPAPDAVFIGGHGGRLKEIVHKITDRLAADGMIVFNSVSDDSYESFMNAAREAGLQLNAPVDITVNNYNPIAILCAIKPI